VKSRKRARRISKIFFVSFISQERSERAKILRGFKNSYSEAGMKELLCDE
jgi:hypothetical protein